MTRVKQCLLAAALLCIAALAGGWGYFHNWIQRDVERFSEAAQQSSPKPGDDVAALIAYVESGEHSLRDRNHAVWALGQLRDPRALPVLQAAFTGGPCDHGRFLCQKELGKAIELCRGGTPNILFIHARRTRAQ